MLNLEYPSGVSIEVNLQPGTDSSKTISPLAFSTFAFRPEALPPESMAPGIVICRCSPPTDCRDVTACRDANGCREECT